MADTAQFAGLLNERSKELRDLINTGVDPKLIRALGPEKAKALAAQGPRIQAGMERASKMPLGRYATLGAAGLGAATTAAGGDLLGGLGEFAGGLAGGAVGQMGAGAVFKAAGAAIPPAGPLGIGLKVGLPLVGAMLGGGIGKTLAGGAGQAAQEAGASPSGPDIAIAGVPLTQAARERQMRERDRAQTIQDITQVGGAQQALDKDMFDYSLKKSIEQQKAMLPLMEQINRSNLVNAQAMLASQTAAYQQLGRQAGMFKLAGGAQAEAGATLRTAISQNPYLGATLSAPNINFG
jgi:hypothetical protein